MEAEVNVLPGWEIDQLLKLRERQPDLLGLAVQLGMIHGWLKVLPCLR